jgi:hypothetical protein
LSSLVCVDDQIVRIADSRYQPAEASSSQQLATTSPLSSWQKQPLITNQQQRASSHFEAISQLSRQRKQAAAGSQEGAEASSTGRQKPAAVSRQGRVGCKKGQQKGEEEKKRQKRTDNM